MIEDSEILTELAALEARTQAVQRILRQRLLQLVTTQMHPSHASYAAALIAGRRALTGYVDCAYFGDPAFDILLDLFVVAERDEQRSVKACTIASGTASTLRCWRPSAGRRSRSASSITTACWSWPNASWLIAN